MRIFFHSEATGDLAEAAAYYERQQVHLGTRFLDDVDAALDFLAGAPDAGAPVGVHTPDRPTRRLVLRRFPFSIVYRASDTSLYVIAVAHHSRDPQYWIHRTD